MNLKNSKASVEENQKKLNFQNENTNKENHLKSSTNKATSLLSDPFAKLPIPSDLLNTEIGKISKKVTNFKLNEESSDKNFTTNENIDPNFYSAPNNFGNFTKKNSEAKMPFPSSNLSEKNSETKMPFPKVNPSKTTKEEIKQENGIGTKILKRKRVTDNPKKYEQQFEDNILDFEIPKRNLEASKRKLNTDKQPFIGRFNQINGKKIESFRAYRDDEINIPKELQTQIHIKPKNEPFDDDISSDDELIMTAKLHYSAQFNLLKRKNYNFNMCNNFKYTQGVYWDD